MEINEKCLLSQINEKAIKSLDVRFEKYQENISKTVGGIFKRLDESNQRNSDIMNEISQKQQIFINEARDHISTIKEHQKKNSDNITSFNKELQPIQQNISSLKTSKNMQWGLFLALLTIGSTIAIGIYNKQCDKIDKEIIYARNILSTEVEKLMNIKKDIKDDIVSYNTKSKNKET